MECPKIYMLCTKKFCMLLLAHIRKKCVLGIHEKIWDKCYCSLWFYNTKSAALYVMSQEFIWKCVISLGTLISFLGLCSGQ